MARNDKGAGFAASLIIGLLLIPVSAVAAYAIVSGSSDTDSPASTVAMTTAETTSTAPAPTTTSAGETFVVEPVSATREDLERACGEDGFTLVAAEADGTISDVQQAALDALRQVCAESGMELPGPPMPEPVVRTVTIQASSQPSPTSSAPTASGGDDGYYDDDHHEYEDDDHNEYEDDEHEHEEDD